MPQVTRVVRSKLDVLYFYIEGSDLEEVESKVIGTFAPFSNDIGEHVWLVNERFERARDLRPEDLPDWNLGINVKVDAVQEQELTKIIEASAQLAARIGRSVIVGGGSTLSALAEDWFSIDGNDAEAAKAELFSHLR